MILLLSPVHRVQLLAENKLTITNSKLCLKKAELRLEVIVRLHWQTSEISVLFNKISFYIKSNIHIEINFEALEKRPYRPLLEIFLMTAVHANSVNPAWLVV